MSKSDLITTDSCDSKKKVVPSERNPSNLLCLSTDEKSCPLSVSVSLTLKGI